MVSNHTYLKIRVSTECLLHVCHPEIAVTNSVSKNFFLYIKGLLPRMQSMKDCCCCYRCRRCCFRGGRDFAAFVEATVSRCMPEGLTFVSTVVRILWNILVIFHGWLGRFEAYIIEVLFLLVQFRTVFHHPRIMKIHSEIVRSIQCWYLYWVINFKFFLQFYWSKIDGKISFFSLMFLMSFSAMKWCFCHGSWASRLRIFLRARILNSTNSLLMYKFITPKKYFSREEMILFFRTLPGSVQKLLN